LLGALKLCLQNAKYAYYTELLKAAETAKGCLLDWGLAWVLSTLVCIARVFASGVWAVVTLLGCVGSITSIGGAIQCLNDFATEVTNDLHDYNRDVRACCREACYRQGLSNCDQL